MPYSIGATINSPYFYRHDNFSVTKKQIDSIHRYLNLNHLNRAKSVYLNNMRIEKFNGSLKNEQAIAAYFLVAGVK